MPPQPPSQKYIPPHLRGQQFPTPRNRQMPPKYFLFPADGICIWIEEIKWFLRDMRFPGGSFRRKEDQDKSGLLWLIHFVLTHDGMLLPQFVTGMEQLPELNAGQKELFNQIKDSLETAEVGTRQPRKAVAFAGCNSSLFTDLQKLRFHCGGSILCFPAKKGEHPFSALSRDDQLKRPQLLSTWSTNEGMWIPFHAVGIGVHVAQEPSGRKLKVFCIIDKNKNHDWFGFVGGSISRGTDKTPIDTIKREWEEEVGQSFDSSCKTDSDLLVPRAN